MALPQSQQPLFVASLWGAASGTGGAGAAPVAFAPSARRKLCSKPLPERSQTLSIISLPTTTVF